MNGFSAITPAKNKIDRWWSIPLGNLLQSLSIDLSRGLSQAQVDRSRSSFGQNTLEELKPTKIWGLILDGVKEPMMVVLLSIVGLSLFFGKPAEAAVMVFVVAAYISVEFINKYRSDRTMARLRELTQRKSKE